jgi:hypothetical protein
MNDKKSVTFKTLAFLSDFDVAKLQNEISMRTNDYIRRRSEVEEKILRIALEFDIDEISIFWPDDFTKRVFRVGDVRRLLIENEEREKNAAN